MFCFSNSAIVLLRFFQVKYGIRHPGRIRRGLKANMKKRIFYVFGIIISVTLSVNVILHGQGIDDEIMKKLFGNNAAEKASVLAHIEKEKPRQVVELLREKIKITRDLETKLTVIEALSKFPVRLLIPLLSLIHI